MAETQVLEGTWEEILRRTAELKGHRVRVTVLAVDNNRILPQAELPWEEEERLLDEMAAASQNLPVLPPEANRREWMYGEHD